MCIPSVSCNQFWMFVKLTFSSLIRIVSIQITVFYIQDWLKLLAGWLRASFEWPDNSECHLNNWFTGCLPYKSGRGWRDGFHYFPCLQVQEIPVQHITLFSFFLPTTTPATVPVAVCDPHHDQKEDKNEEDEARDGVHDGWGGGDGDPVLWHDGVQP